MNTAETKVKVAPPSLNSITKLLPTAVFLTFGAIIGAASILVKIILSPSKFFLRKSRSERPSCMNDPTLGEHKFARLENGMTLHYVVNGPSSKPLMLFLHGFPDCWYSWRYQIRHFSETHTTVAVDMRGYGESDKPGKVSDYAIQYLANDVKELIEHLGYKKAVLVAHDWGGIVAFWVSFLYPEVIEKLVVCNIPHPKAFAKHFSKSLSQIRKSWYTMFFQIPLLPELYIRSNDFGMIDDLLTIVHPGGSKAAVEKVEDRDAFKYSLSQGSSVTCLVNYYRAALWYRRPIRNTPKTCVPTLMCWGELDLALEKQMAEYSRDYIDDFELQYIPTAGHWVQQEEPQKVNDFITEFLKSKKKN